MTDLATWLAAMRALVAQATPGPWWIDPQRPKLVWPNREATRRRPPVAKCDNTHGLGQHDVDDRANASYIAALDPTTVTRILDVIEAAEALVTLGRLSANATGTHDAECPARRVAGMLRWERVEIEKCTCPGWAPLVDAARALADLLGEG